MPEQFFHSTTLVAPGNQTYLERKRIDLLLEKAIKNPIVVVNAGAGYGKTHAVYSFVREYKVFTGWMQLSERDNIRDRFWENFIATIALVNKPAALKLEKIDFPETERQFDRYMSIPMEETPLERKGIVFAYDDFHLIRDEAVLRFIERSITSPFPYITSILISRTDPPLNLMKIESKGKLARITEEDLRFTQEEMVSYFQLLDVSPSPQVVSSVYHDTEGWAFAIHLAGLSLKHAASGAVYVNQALRSNIFKLIESEIMAPLPSPVQRFLIKLSLIEYLASNLLEELAEDPAIMRGMKEIDTFIRFDVYRDMYHIHHLFLEYLKARQNELSEEEKRDVWRKTAAWCAANDQKMDAISYYEKVGDYNQVITLSLYFPMMMSNQISRILLDMLNKAPKELYEENPLSHTIRLRVLMSLNRSEQAAREMQEAITKLEAQPLSTSIHRMLTMCYGNKGFIRLMACPYTRDYDFAADFERCAYHGRLNGGYVIPFPISVLNIGSYICRVNSPEKGAIERYIDALAAIVPLSAGALSGIEWGADTLARTELAFFKGDMSGAEQWAIQTLQRAREQAQYEVENRALFYLLRIYLARGNYEAIPGIFKQLDALLEQTYYVNRLIDHDIVTGWYYSQIGQTDKAARWVKNDFEGNDLNSMTLGLEVLVKAKCHLADRRYSIALAALAVMESRKNEYDAGDFLFGRISMKAQEAVCRYRNRDKDGAFAALKAAYELALPNELFMPFMELGKDMRALADAALKDTPPGLPTDWLEKIRAAASAYAKKLFTVAEHYRPAPPLPGEEALGKSLSHRELEVLANLFQGMTREEIAGASSLSVNTVKSIIRSIYNKLGAINKADAVRIAASRGLV